ncbi:hypothetical protein KPSA1_04772 [Pseudomonas syringae pv. actinidiae]|uniref:Uncharacterized protein n=1 Tax=Pseudomonas syringae pv. actinidiae TaxID=103796 RepID=A0A2V0R5A9_PSESF|nr:hypothetical protein KPSA1_04772 [Pseudomonas syringae pv. actinidiae]GBH16712.1 hypothetical protein KPSA3_02667 [Pseudomonas syringae pv. actinidiae]
MFTCFLYIISHLHCASRLQCNGLVRYKYGNYSFLPFTAFWQRKRWRGVFTSPVQGDQIQRCRVRIAGYTNLYASFSFGVIDNIAQGRIDYRRWVVTW